jgi:hypothetical protein
MWRWLAGRHRIPRHGRRFLLSLVAHFQRRRHAKQVVVAWN